MTPKQNIKIIWLSGIHDCETCGWTWATGYKAFLNGELIKEFIPHTDCLGGDDIDEVEAYKQILEALGFEVVEKG